MKKNYFLTLLLILITAASFGQTEIFNVAGGGTLPAGWVGENNVTSNPIDKGSYYLLEEGSPSDVLTTSSYDLSAYPYAVFKLDIASFGSGAQNRVKIEVSTDGGTTFTDLGVSNYVATEPYYVAGGPIRLPNVSNQVQLRLSNSGTTGRGIRLKNLILLGLTSDPSLSINSPTEGQIFPSTTTYVLTNVDVYNFEFPRDNSSKESSSDNGAEDGGGFIKQTLVTPSGTTTITFKDNPGPVTIPVTAGESYTLTLELVDNTRASLSPAVSKTVHFSVAPPPSLSITSPTEGQVFPSTDTSVPVNVSVNNFTFFNEGSEDGGFIKQTLVTPSGTSITYESNASRPYTIPVTAGEAYRLTLELVDNTRASLSPAVSKTVHFSVAPPPPSLSITSPTEGQVFPSTDTSVTVNVTVNNFNFLNDSDFGGFIKQTLVTPSGTSITFKDNARPYTIPVTAGEAYTLTLELFADREAPLDPAVSKTVHFSVAPPPSLSITSPTEGQVFPSTDTSVTVNVTVNNFNFSADIGDGISDGSGDGFIEVLLVTPSGSRFKNKFDASPEIVPVVAGESYTLTMDLVNNEGAPLSPPVSKTVHFSVAFPCNLQLGTITKTCNATTSGIDTYTATIPYTGGATSTYTLNTDMGDMGNISGNNPSTEATGTITISDIPEGTNIVFTVNGDASNSSCSLTRNISSPTCKAFPVYEPFDYTAGTDLIASADWQNNSTSSDEIQVVTGTITSPYNAGDLVDPVGNMINFAGVGSDSYTTFNDTTSGTIYTSFLFTPTDMSTVTNSNGAYWAGLTTTTGSFVARLWVKPDATDAAKFNVGVSFTSDSSDVVYDTNAYTAGDIMFLVMAYNLDNNLVSVWVNPNASTFEGASAPTATFTKANADAADLGRFFIRQDSNETTANTNFDELRIGTTWAEVTPKSIAASVEENSISGFNAYPNPTDNLLTVSSFSSNKKQVTIYNVLGKKVFSTTFTGTQKTINVSNINSGIYILKVTEAGKTSTKKLVIK